MNDEKKQALETLTNATGALNDLEKAFWILMGGANLGGLLTESEPVTSSSGVVTIDASGTSNYYTLTLTENVTGWSFSNLPEAGKYTDITVEIIQNASSSKTCVSPATAGRTAGFSWSVSGVLSSRETLGIRLFSDGTRYLYPSGVLA